MAGKSQILVQDILGGHLGHKLDLHVVSIVFDLLVLHLHSCTDSP